MFWVFLRAREECWRCICLAALFTYNHQCVYMLNRVILHVIQAFWRMWISLPNMRTCKFYPQYVNTSELPSTGFQTIHILPPYPLLEIQFITKPIWYNGNRTIFNVKVRGRSGYVRSPFTVHRFCIWVLLPQRNLTHVSRLFGNLCN